MTFLLSGSNGSSSGGSHILHANGRLDAHTLLGQEVNQERAGDGVPVGVERQLVVLVLDDAVQVDVEEVRGVQGTALGLGVELGAEDGTSLVDHTLVARIVQVDEVGLPVGRQGGGINSITVVLAGDVAAASSGVQCRDVVSTVTILELDGTSTVGQSQELVTQTDTEDGHLGGLHQATEVVDGVLAVSRVTGAVGDEDTIKVVSDLVDGVVEGEHSDTGSTADQATQNVLLDTAVDHSDVALGVGSADVERSLGADLTDQVDLLRVDEGLILVSVVLLTDGDTSEGRTLLTEVGDNGTSVDAGDGGHTLTGTPFTETLDGSPVAVLLSHIGDDDTSGLEVGRLKVLEQTVLVPLSGGNTVVTDQRLGEDQDLTTVGGVGQRLGVSDQGSGENGFTRNVGAGSKGLPMEDGAISDRKSGTFSGGTSLTDGSHEAGLDGSIHGGEGRGPGGHGLEHTSEHCDMDLFVARKEYGGLCEVDSEVSGSFPEVIRDVVLQISCQYSINAFQLNVGMVMASDDSGGEGGNAE